MEQSTEDLSCEEQDLLSDAYEKEASAHMKKLEGMRSNSPPHNDISPEEAACIEELTEICEEILVSTCTCTCRNCMWH